MTNEQIARRFNRMAALMEVRGEDSFVRAQWAALPFVWQAYPQADAAHLTKVAAFLDRYCIGLPLSATAAVSALLNTLPMPRSAYHRIRSSARSCATTPGSYISKM